MRGRRTQASEARLARSSGAGSAAEDGSVDPVLRAKYLDYCSARVADLLLQLTPDEMYVLAQDAAEELDPDQGLSYSEIVRLATDRISRKLSLPDFHSWVRAYLAHPEAFDREMLGLWETDTRPSRRGT